MIGNFFQSIGRYSRVLGQWLLFVVLALGMAKAPLAYSCIPLLDDSDTPVKQLTNADSPCHLPNRHIPPADPKRECCLVSLDNGLRGGDSGFLPSQSLTQTSADAPAILPADATNLLPRRPTSPAFTVSPLPSAVPANGQPPYLLTQRFRL